MLQRQIMVKQMQELQRRQQLQELGNTRNQAYANQLSALKQASGSQFSPAVNREPFQDSQHMFMLGNMQMAQPGGASLPNGLVPPQSHQYDSGHLGLSQPQFDMGLYGTSAPNVDKNLNQYSLLQEPSDMGRNSNSTLGMSVMQPSDFGNSFMSQRGNFSSDQISATHGQLLENQVFQEKNLFGQVHVQSFDNGTLPEGYSQQGTTMQRNAPTLESEGSRNDGAWNQLSPGKVSNYGAASLDPLEQKILYSSDDCVWDSSFSASGKMGTKDFENQVENTRCMDELPSLQSGSWSALMQSALEEMSGTDNKMQEEWSGLSFQNPETSIEKSYFVNNGKPQNNWVDRNLQNESSPSSNPEKSVQKSNMNYIFPGFQQSGHQHLHQQEEFHNSAQHSPRSPNQSADYNSQQKHPIRGSQLIHTSVSSPSIWPDQHNEHMKSHMHQPSLLSRSTNNQPPGYFSGHEFRDNTWVHQSTPQHVAGGIQKPFDQAHQSNIHRYSIDPDKMAPGDNVEPMSTLMGASPDFCSQNVPAQSENQPNKDDMSNNHTSGTQWNSKVSAHSERPLTESSMASLTKSSTNLGSRGFGFTLGRADPQTPHPHSFFPSLSMGNSSAASLSGHNVNEYIKNQGQAVPSHLASKYSMGVSPSRADMSGHENVSSLKLNKLSHLFSPPDSASSSLETSSGAPNERQNQSSWKHEHNIHAFGTHPGKSQHLEKQLQKGMFFNEGSTEINNSALLSGSTQKPEIFRNNHSEEDSVASGSLMIPANQQPSSQADKTIHEIPDIHAKDIGSFDHSSGPNYSMPHQVHSPKNAEINKMFPKNYGVDYQQGIANANDMVSSGQKSGVKDAVSEFGASSSGNKGWNFAQEGVGDGSGKDFPMGYLQNFQSMDMFAQNNLQNHSMGINETSNVTHPSPMNPQMASSLFKLYGNLRNGQMLPLHNFKAPIGAAQALSSIPHRNLQENSLILPVSSDNATQSLWPSTAGASIASKQESLSILASDVCYQNFVPSVPKKRKIFAFDMVPWYKEVNSEPLRHLNTSSESMAELEWAQASNRRQEEVMQVKNEAEIVEDPFFPVVHPKRRLTFTTQLMQQVFRPPPANILRADVDLTYDSVVHVTARLVLGDASSMAHLSPPGTSDGARDKLKTSNKRNACDFSEVVEVLVSKVEKLEEDISRLDKSSSIVDIKVANQELEKFAMLNRFAKFHIKAPPSTVDPTSTNVPKTAPQRYVIAVQMPRTLPDGVSCISL